jgi:hypothetical protein
MFPDQHKLKYRQSGHVCDIYTSGHVWEYSVYVNIW